MAKSLKAFHKSQAASLKDYEKRAASMRSRLEKLAKWHEKNTTFFLKYFGGGVRRDQVKAERLILQNTNFLVGPSLRQPPDKISNFSTGRNYGRTNKETEAIRRV